MNKLTYITYQTFPSQKANTIQTIENLKYLGKIFDVELIFPDRDKKSSGKLRDIQEFYSFNEEFKISIKRHNFPFGKVHFLEKYLYIFSHFLWARSLCKEIYEEIKNDYIFTRSDWIFFFLSRKNLNITFECHQITKIRPWIIRKSIHNSNSKVICLNKKIMEDLKIDSKYKDKVIVLHNGVDAKNYVKSDDSNRNELIFIGNLKRFNENRNLKFVINCFKNKKIKSNFTMKIIGGPIEELVLLRKFIKDQNLQDKVELLEWIPREKVLNEIEKSGIGLLINSSKDKHSVLYTSPLKYFEYLYAGLNIIAVNFHAHKTLPYSENIEFFDENNEESFINALNNFPSQSNNLTKEELRGITLEFRAKEIFNFIKK